MDVGYCVFLRMIIIEVAKFKLTADKRLTQRLFIMSVARVSPNGYCKYRATAFLWASTIDAAKIQTFF